MVRSRSHSAQTSAVLEALGQDPTTWRYGYDLCLELGLNWGSASPTLIRLVDRGLLESSGEPPERGGPPRPLSRLSDAGVAEAAEAAMVDGRSGRATAGRPD